MKQIPQIYEATASAIDGYALGSLPDALECKVTEERNGEFFLQMTYPANGLNAILIRVGRIIGALPDMYGSMQGFRIATITKALDGTMEITAYHVSYDLAQVIVMPFTAATLDLALAGLEANAVPANGFSLSSDMTKTATFTVTEPTPLRSLLVGMEGSLVDVYGGELRFNNWEVELLSSRGQSRNVQIAYGKNLTDFKETDEIAAYDAVVPFAVWNETTYTLTDTTTYPTAPIVYADGSGALYGYPKTIPLDLSDKFSENEPTEAELYAYAQSYIAKNSVDPSVHFATEYLDLAKLIGNVERVDLCDTVYITVLPFNVQNLTAKVISVTYNVLLDENDEVKIGDRKITLADTLAETIIATERKTGTQIGLRNADATRY